MKNNEKESNAISIPELAARIDAFGQWFDPYEYADQVSDPEEGVQEVLDQLRAGEIDSFLTFFEKAMDNVKEQAQADPEAAKMVAEATELITILNLLKKEAM